MPRETLDGRVAGLERKVDMLETLAERVGAVESQILQLRGDVSVLRTEMQERHGQAIHHAEGLSAQTIRVVETLHAETNQRMEVLNAETVRQMHELNAETRRHMRVLHEEVIDRIARLGDERGSS